MQEPARTELFSLLYVSRMTRPSGAEVAAICRQAQINNEREGITGLLVFDGEAFCQLVEGAEAALSLLLHRLERDPRHVDMQVLHFGRAPTRRFPAWRMGYAFAADPQAIGRVQRGVRHSGVDAFHEVVAALAPTSDAGPAR
jgi:hypothetical protein